MLRWLLYSASKNLYAKFGCVYKTSEAELLINFPALTALGWLIYLGIVFMFMFALSTLKVL